MHISHSVNFLLTLLSLLVTVTEERGEEENCSELDTELNTRDIPNKWKAFLKDFDEANKNYLPCTEEQVDNNQVSCLYSQVIQKDLAPFNQNISFQQLEETRQVVTHPVTYQLIDGQLYRSKGCLFPSRCEGVEHFLLKLAKERHLPNFELVLNTHDWPYIDRHFHSEPLPLFSFSKTTDYFDIFFPAWTFWAGGPAISKYPTGIGRWDLMRKQLQQASKQWPWKSKINVAFFRGSRTSGERDNLIKLSQNMPQIVDARYTKNQAWKSKEDTLGFDAAEEVSFEDHCQYKYLFNYRGVAASFRLKHLFLCGSTVLHVGSEWLEFFYPPLKPWVHYVPVDANASQNDIKHVVLFLQNHPQVAKTIADNGHTFIDQHLRMQDVENYWFSLLEKYATMLRFVPERHKNYIHVHDKQS